MLTDRQLEVLSTLGLRHRYPTTLRAIGGTQGSHHAQVLRALTDKGLVARSLAINGMNLYLITPTGLAELKKHAFYSDELVK